MRNILNKIIPQKKSSIIDNLYKVIVSSMHGCEGEFQTLPFIITYLYAHDRLTLKKVKTLAEIQEDIVIYQYAKKNSIQVLTSRLDRANPTDNLIKETIIRTIENLSKKESKDNIHDSMFELYDSLKECRPHQIKEYIGSLFSLTLKLYFNVTDISNYYQLGRDKKSFHELSRLMLLLLTQDKKSNYSILHKNAGSANFVEHLADNITYYAQFDEKYRDFQCLYQMLTIVKDKKANLCFEENSIQTDAVIYDDIIHTDTRQFWNLVVRTVKNKQEGIFLAESDVLFEFKNTELTKALKGIDILSYVSHVIFLPKGLILILVCKKKNTEDVILLDETRFTKILSDSILNDFKNQRNTIRLEKQEYLSRDFTFALNDILGKKATSLLKKETSHIIPLKELLCPSNIVCTNILDLVGIDSHDYNYSGFYPFYIIENDHIINVRDIETIKKYKHHVLLFNVIEKHMYQPKVLCFNKFDGSISMDELAFNIKEDQIDLNYLVNEMNKKYFIDQLFPTNIKLFEQIKWEHLQECCIKMPVGGDTITPIERQRLFFNADKMDFINQNLNSYNYNIERILRSGTEELSAQTTLLNDTYTIIGSIKNGGFGKTYKAIKKNDDGTTTLVAIKEFFYNGLHKRDCDSNDVIYLANVNDDIVKVRKDFFNEASKIRTFANCPNIVRVIDVFDENNTSYYSMEYLDGENLYDYVTTKVGGRLCEKEALTIIRGIANALTEMHKVEMLHMDVKPNNVVVCKDGRIVLIDFGGSRNYKLSSDEGHTIAALNSPGYTPPEGLINRIPAFKPTYDIYSLGATLNFMLTGEGDSENSQIINNKNRESSVNNLPDSVSSETQQCITKSLNYSPVNRPQSIEDFLALLPSL